VDSVREIHQVDQDDQLLTTELWSPSPAGPAQRNRSVPISDRVEADLRATGWRPADEPGWV
jgi:hypothetical protein